MENIFNIPSTYNTLFNQDTQHKLFTNLIFYSVYCLPEDRPRGDSILFYVFRFVCFMFLKCARIV